MTRLLISVRSADEAIVCVHHGANVIIDVKEPNRGSLGRADNSVWRDVVRVTEGTGIPVSVALGELQESPSFKPGEFDGITYAKTGLSGCTRISDWTNQWRAVLRQFPAHILPVAVVYVDPTADAPSPTSVLQAAIDSNCPLLLMDTFDKTQGSLLDHFAWDSLRTFVREAQSSGISLALAGSIRETDIPRVLELQPEIIAVRGAVCDGTRIGAISPRLVSRVARWFEQFDSRLPTRSDSAVRA